MSDASYESHLQDLLAKGLSTEEEIGEARRLLQEAEKLGRELSVSDALLRAGARAVKAQHDAAAMQALTGDTDAEVIQGSDLVVIERLGRGSQSVVYKCHQITLDRTVAVKILPSSMARNPATRERFFREARHAARLSHPNIVAIHQISPLRDTFYIVMEFVDGGSVAEMLAARKRFDPAEAATIVRAAALGLACAHRAGIIHQDIKPKNILLTSTGVVKIADLGVARRVDDSDAAASASAAPPAGFTGAASKTTQGTPYYMSPEQITGDPPVDFRTDIYSLGATFYEMLTGRPPFTAATPQEVMRKHVVEPVPDPRRDVPDLAPAISAIIARCMAKEPEDRYAGAGEFIAALDKLDFDAPLAEVIELPPEAEKPAPAASSFDRRRAERAAAARLSVAAALLRAVKAAAPSAAAPASPKLPASAKSPPSAAPPAGASPLAGPPLAGAPPAGASPPAPGASYLAPGEYTGGGRAADSVAGAPHGPTGNHGGLIGGDAQPPGADEPPVAEEVAVDAVVAADLAALIDAASRPPAADGAAGAPDERTPPAASASGSKSDAASGSKSDAADNLAAMIEAASRPAAAARPPDASGAANPGPGARPPALAELSAAVQGRAPAAPPAASGAAGAPDVRTPPAASASGSKIAAGAPDVRTPPAASAPGAKSSAASGAKSAAASGAKSAAAEPDQPAAPSRSRKNLAIVGIFGFLLVAVGVVAAVVLIIGNRPPAAPDMQKSPAASASSPKSEAAAPDVRTPPAASASGSKGEAAAPDVRTPPAASASGSKGEAAAFPPPEQPQGASLGRAGIRVDCGSDRDYIDGTRRTWAADQEFSGTRAWGYVGGQQVRRAPHNIPGTGCPDVFLTERFALTAYRFRMAPGKYFIRMRFAETDGGVTRAGQRVFGVKIQGKQVLTNFDVIKDAGGAFKPVSKDFKDIMVGADGMLTIEFQPQVNVPEINGIEIMP